MDTVEAENLLIQIKLGTILKVFFSEGNFNNCIYHVLGIFDGDEIALKYWGKHKQRWFYEFQSIYYFYFLNQSGNLTIKN
jgi:hypothetical protein